ncbi:D-amino acid dehydrogenase [Pseudomonas sp. S75]|uniref:D-amino acid dehydrogenase n=1 Tax=unclassified Pseudomonas TaxID=196821 RepID=UPI00190495D4|nr:MULTISPECIES: D-amino acid dehydrogenase [unclassified Pseudomonas]MBJ9976437.1 D-amino acid dehydrogenase [Pseudomonas sp. S30]MBK0155663.1 D-amino acid dehydrogenase [Pseudomonas sp. S75]
MHVVVIGAGVIGLSSAFYLARSGVQVTLVERHCDVARETSFANGGQLSYNNVAPLADPSVLGHLPRWLLSGEAPLRVRPRLDPRQWRWCLAFLRACSGARVQRTFGEMLGLSMRSQSLLTELLQCTPLDFDLRRSGKLIIHRSAASLEAGARALERQQHLGARFERLTADQCVAREPALVHVAERLAGGLFTPGDAVGNCRLFCEGLARHLQAMDNVQFRLGETVTGFDRRGRRLTALRLGQQRLEADGFVVASGIASVELLAPLGIDLPLYPLRGYTLSVSPGADVTLPRISITDASRKILYARLGDSLRIAAMVDLGARTAQAPQGRIALLKRQVGEVFPALDLAPVQAWAGLRPATAQGKPIIDRAPGLDNLWLNVGHGPLGFTLACASGEGLARLVTEDRVPEHLAPFSLAAHRNV